MPTLLPLLLAVLPIAAPEMQHVRISKDGKGFVLASSGTVFRPIGFNYDHDSAGRLLEDYWVEEWPMVERHFRHMRDLGASVVRIHLQFGRFMHAADRPDEASLRQLERLLKLAEKERLYLDLTGLGCYHKKDVPAWYDALAEEQRWQAQERFWQAVAGRCAASPAVFCYDLMNEPVVAGAKRKPGEWLGGAFGDKHFVQFISLDPAGRKRPDIARQWTRRLTRAIRAVDRRHLVTVGLVDWSLDRPGLTSGFVPTVIAPEVDFLCVHLYPKTGKTKEALETLAGFAVGKPVVIEETFPLACSAAELGRFLDAATPTAAGWIGFYWGTPPKELRQAKTLPAAMMLAWLELFQQKARGARTGLDTPATGDAP